MFLSARRKVHLYVRRAAECRHFDVDVTVYIFRLKTRHTHTHTHTLTERERGRERKKERKDRLALSGSQRSSGGVKQRSVWASHVQWHDKTVI